MWMKMGRITQLTDVSRHRGSESRLHWFTGLLCSRGPLGGRIHRPQQTKGAPG